VEFYAAWDNRITTTTPWNRPGLFSLIKTWDELKSKHNFDNYDVYVAGGFAEYLHQPTNPLTWDIDLCYVPKSDKLNYSEIKAILDDSIKIGFENLLLIDVKLIPKITWDFFRKLHSDYYPTQNEIDKVWYITNWDSFYKNIDGVVERDTKKEPSDYTKLPEGLYRFDGTGNGIIEKVKEKIDSGLYKNKYIDLKVSDFNFTQ